MMLIRQTLAYFPAQILSPIIQFVTAIVLTYKLGTADYGLTMLIFASQELIFQVVLAWWTSYFLRYAGTHEHEEGRRNVAALEASILLVTGAVQILATLLLVAISTSEPSAGFTLAACAYVLTRSFLNFLSEKARRAERILDYTVLQIGTSLASLVLTLVMIAWSGATPTRVLTDFALMHGVITLWVAWRMKVLALPGRFSMATLMAALRFGIPVSVSNLFGWLSSQGIRFVVQYGAGAAALGLLSVAWGIAIRLTVVAAMVVAAAAYPLAVRAAERGDLEGARRQLSNNSALLLGLIAPSTAGLIAINDPFVTLLVGAEFRDATIQLLPWALICAGIRNLRMHGWDQMYLLFEAPRPMVILEALEALVTALAAWLGLVMFGLQGAVIGAALAAFVVAVADYAYLNRRFGLRAPLGFYLKVTAATAIMVGAVWAMPALGMPVTPSWPSLLLAITVGGLAYILAILVLFGGMIRTGLREWKARRA
jgi:O-antigen/teichoic acid export membrane protein